MTNRGIARVTLLIAVIAGVLISMAYSRYVSNKEINTSEITAAAPITSYSVEKNAKVDLPIEKFDKSCENKFCAAYARALLMLNKDKVFYYIKNGDIYMLNVDDGKISTILSADEDILYFAISNDKTKIAYSILESDFMPGIDELFVNKRGNAVYIKDFVTDETKLAYRISNVNTEMQLRDLSFTPDDKQLIITSNGIRVYTLESQEIKDFFLVRYNDLCASHYVDDISPNSKLLLITKGCLEGSTQFILDIESGRKVSTFENGYAAGGEFATAFINNESLLGYNNRIRFDEENPGRLENIYSYVVYDLFGKRLAELQTFEIETSPRIVEKTDSSLYLYLGDSRFYTYNIASQTFTELDNELPHVLYTINNEKLWFRSAVLPEYKEIDVLEENGVAEVVIRE